MGFNSTVVVLNDALTYIESDPNFGKKLVEAISMFNCKESNDVTAGCHGNAATVVDCHHADVVSIVAIGGNHGTVLNHTHNGGRHHDEADQVVFLKKLAEKFGYVLKKVPKKAAQVGAV